nr:hypothetical protein [Bifidobacterium leontopitheci]
MNVFIDQNVCADGVAVIHVVPKSRHQFMGVGYSGDMQAMVGVLLRAKDDRAAIGVGECAVRLP